MAYTIAAFGHRPGGLGGLWVPRQWMPAIELVRIHICRCVSENGATVVRTTAESGFGLIVSAATLLAKDEGIPLQLAVFVPYPGWGEAKDFGTRTARNWHDRIMARPDVDVFQFVDRPPLNKAGWDAVEHQRRAAMIGSADQALLCWNGGEKNETAKAAQMAAVYGVETVNLFDEVGHVLRFKLKEEPFRYDETIWTALEQPPPKTA